MKKKIKKILFDGEILGFKFLKLFLTYLPFIGIIIFFQPKYFVNFGDFGWYCLLFIVFVRPLSDILPKLKILRKLVILRKEIGIISGVFITLHGIGYFLDSRLPIFYSLLNSTFYKFDNFFGWGMIGMYLGIILTITSNVFSMKILGKNWKKLQRFTYLFFIFGAIHIGFVDKEKILPLSIVVGTWFILWILAYKKIKFYK